MAEMTKKRKLFSQTRKTTGKANLKFMQCCYGFPFMCIALSHLWERIFRKFILWAFGNAFIHYKKSSSSVSYRKMECESYET